MAGSALALPDLTALAGERDAVLGGIAGLAKAIPADPASVAKSLVTASGAVKGAVPGDPSQLTGTLQTSISALAGKLPAGGLPAVTEIEHGLSEALSLIEPVREFLTKDGSVRDLRAVVLDLAGDPTERLTDLLTRLTGAFPAESVEVLKTFVDTIKAFESNIPADPEQIGEFLARGFLGIPSDLLTAPVGAVDGFLHGLGTLVDAGHVTSVGTELAGIAVDLAAIETSLEALDPANAAAYGPIAAALGSLKTRMLALRGSLETLAASYRSAVQAIDLTGLVNPLATALAAVPEVHVASPDDFIDVVMTPIRELNAAVDVLTPAEVAAALQGLQTYVQGLVAGQGTTDVLDVVVKPFADIGSAIESLRLERIRTAFEHALEGVGQAVGDVTGAIGTVRSGLVSALDAAATPLATVTAAGAEVETALKKVGDALQAATGGASLKGLHDKSVAVIGELQTALGDASSGIKEAMTELEGLIGQIEGIDLGAASREAVDLIGKLTGILKSIDLSALPDPVVQDVKRTLSAALGRIDLTPVHDALGGAVEAGPGKLLLEFSEKLDALAEQIARFSPAGLLQPVVEPFNHIVDGLSALAPERLLDPVIDELHDLRLKLEALSPARLVAPFEQPLDEARSSLEALAPTKLLAPLNEPFKGLEELVGKLDLTPFLDELDAFFGDWVGQALGGFGKLGDAFAGAGEMKAFVDGLGGPVDAELGFRPGDVLRPVQDLYEKLVGLIEGLPAATLVAAFESLRVRVVGALDAIAPGGLAVRLAERLGEVRAGFDLDADFALVEEVFSRYSAVRISFDAVDEVRVPGAASASFTAAATLVVEVDPERAIGPVRPLLASARASATGVVSGLDVTALAPAFAPVAERLEALIPDFLRNPLTADSIKAELQALNPGKLADEVNAEFDAFLAKTGKFADVFTAELPKVMDALKPGSTSVFPAAVKEAFEAVYGPVRTQIGALDPAPLIADLESTVYAPIKASLDGLSLKAIVEDSALQTRFNDLTTTFDGVVSDLVALRSTLATAWKTVADTVLAVSPVAIQAELQTAFAPVATLLESIDLKPLVERIGLAFEHLETEVDDVLAEIVHALQAMVEAIPSGLGGVSAEVDLSAGLAASG